MSPVAVLAYASNSPANINELAWVHLPDTPVHKITGPFVLQPYKEITLDIGVPTGQYMIAMTYMPTSPMITRGSMTVSVDGNAQQVQLSSIWADDSKEYATDRFGHEIIPTQITRQTPHTDFLASSVTLSRRPLIFDLQENSRLTIINHSHELLIQAIYILTPEEILPFDETYWATAPHGQDNIVIEAQDHIAKSHSFNGSGNEQNPRIHPFELERRLINIAGMHRIGERLVWEFYVETAGLYQISFRYGQWAYQEMEVYYNLLINGQIPSTEFINLPFTYTGMPGSFANMTAYTYIHLQAGWNTLSLQADATALQPYYDRIRHILDSLNQITTDLRRLASVTGPGQRHRVWDIETYIPGITQRLMDYSQELSSIFEEFPRISDRNPAPLTVLRVAASDIDRIVDRIDRLPANLNWVGDVSLALADLIGGLQDQPLLLDRIYIHGHDFRLATARMGFFRSLWQGIREFFHVLFGSNDDFAVSGREDNEELVVWVARPIFIVEMMQRLIDSRFTPETGQRVRLSVMPSEQRLILSNASGTNPDAALGIMGHIPFEFALRGALVDFTQFPDFIPFVEEHMNPATLQAFVFGDGIYAITETKTAQIMFYRTDILESLGLEPPDTWDDVMAMMPILRRNGMNFNIPLSQGVGLKSFGGTAPFIFQMQADLYTPDGMGVALNTPGSLAAFDLMTDLFRIYALQDNIPSFYQSFRLGTVPVGVADINQMIAFNVAAPEIDGLWDIGISPGVMGDDGIVRRYQLAVTSTGIIMESSNMQQEAWDFLRWWMSTETQIEFGYNMIYRLGPEFMWSSANLDAFRALPFSDRERSVILEQWQWTREVPRHPASYMVERSISNAWFATVGGQASPRVALDNAITIANREILRRLEEFGYVENGVPVRDFVIRPIESFLSNEFLERRTDGYAFP